MPFGRFITLVALTLSFALPAQGVIYGSNDIREVIDVPAYKELAKSVAISIPNLFLEANSDDTFKVTDFISIGTYLCPREPFINQLSIGNCTGFLVGDRYLVTAGHCFIPAGTIDDEAHPYCQDFSWYFEYQMSSVGISNIDHIPANRLYRCKRVIRAENIDEIIGKNGEKYPGADFSVIELDRPVAPDLKPLKLATRPARVGDDVFTIGHPLGLPAKFSGVSKVRQNDPKREYFEAHLDTFSGNSGGPVFNIRNEVVGILTAGHPVDFATSPTGCERLNRCDESGRNCMMNSVFPDVPVSSQIQKIESVLKYIPSTKP